MEFFGKQDIPRVFSLSGVDYMKYEKVKKFFFWREKCNFWSRKTKIIILVGMLLQVLCNGIHNNMLFSQCTPGWTIWSSWRKKSLFLLKYFNSGSSTWKTAGTKINKWIARIKFSLLINLRLTLLEPFSDSIFEQEIKIKALKILFPSWMAITTIKKIISLMFALEL